jgi:hypothetical protein
VLGTCKEQPAAPENPTQSPALSEAKQSGRDTDTQSPTEFNQMAQAKQAHLLYYGSNTERFGSTEYRVEKTSDASIKYYKKVNGMYSH